MTEQEREAMERSAQVMLDRGFPPWGGTVGQWFTYYTKHFNPAHFKPL
jgi:hypothetical protein